MGQNPYLRGPSKYWYIGGSQVTILIPTWGFWGQSPLVVKIRFGHLTGAYVGKYKLRGIKIV